MKIINALPGMAGAMTEQEVNSFMQSKLNVQLATIDEMGDPSIQPVWFYYDNNTKKLFIETSKESKKVRNLRRKASAYFSIDDENFPYRGVKGKAAVKVIEDAKTNLPIAEKICMKYLDTLDHPLSKMLIDNVKNGTSVVLELAPRFWSTWDMGRVQS
ncbi:pyridoxamine 5'-phosphate oxidase family protein [Candidatus Nitrososphaera sp. FF02]|uniref:pyridoxamine 5'-phosphate oxidase family protein n=1 Tax=Candidatus Nitrososphaera sp. FF02 TaxID=3398226 RepID=UPI0039EAEED3